MADVLFASHSAELAGAERSLLALVDEAASRGHSVTVWAPREGSLTGQLRSLHGDRVDVQVMASHRWMSRRGTGLVGLVRLAQIAADIAAMWWRLRRRPPDVVVVNSSVAPAAMFAAGWRGIPVVTVVRESLRCNPTLRSVVSKNWIMDQIARRSTLVVAVSRYVAEQLGHVSVVVHPPVSAAAYEAPPLVPVPGGLRAVMAGTIGGDKGQLDALAAIALCHANGVPVTLDIFGGGVSRDVRTLRQDISRRGLDVAVTVHGVVPDMTSRWATFDVSVVTSMNEAFGRVTVESLLAGTPVVGYARGGTVEILDAGGGLLVEPGSELLADALCVLARDDEQLGALRASAAARAAELACDRSAGVLVDHIEQVATADN